MPPCRRPERDITFIPGMGPQPDAGMPESRPDWYRVSGPGDCPFPAFVTPEGVTVLTAASTRAAQAFGERGSDAWFNETPAQLLATWDIGADPDVPPGVRIEDLSIATNDIFDMVRVGVILEFGHAAAGIGLSDRSVPRGLDQHRGWFQLSLLRPGRDGNVAVPAGADPRIRQRPPGSQDEQVPRECG